MPAVAIDGALVNAVELTDEQLSAADCVVILTDHPGVNYRRVVELARLVVDTRNATWGVPVPAERVIVL